MYCKNCGSELSENVKFCQYCGTAVQNERPTPSYKREPVFESPQEDKKICGLAIAGFVVSLVALILDILLMVSITGTVLSSVALYQTKKTEKGGKGFAIAGLVIGIVALVINARILFRNFMV